MIRSRADKERITTASLADLFGKECEIERRTVNGDVTVAVCSWSDPGSRVEPWPSKTLEPLEPPPAGNSPRAGSYSGNGFLWLSLERLGLDCPTGGGSVSGRAERVSRWRLPGGRRTAQTGRSTAERGRV